MFLNIMEPDCVISHNKYGKYCVPKSSSIRPAARKILSGEVYEPETIEFMRANCGDGDIVHAGAYFGDFLPALSASVSSGSKVWAFEPDSENYYCARKTLELNEIENVELTNGALASEEGVVVLQTVTPGGFSLGGGSRIITEEVIDERIGYESVEVVATDSVIGSDRKVSIVQLDVEGYEKEALKGGLETIKKDLPFIILENNPESTLIENEWFSENILALGYQPVENLHNNVVFSVSK